MGNSRKLRNYFINPLIQLRLSGFVILLVAAFTLILISYITYTLSDFFKTLVDIADLSPEMQKATYMEILDLGIGLGIISIVFFLFLSLVIIIESHKTLGAIHVIHQHIKENLLKGRFQTLKLRKNSYFKDIAKSLNDLSEKLAEDEKKRNRPDRRFTVD